MGPFKGEGGVTIIPLQLGIIMYFIKLLMVIN